jgi:hypothetical protein
MRAKADRDSRCDANAFWVDVESGNHASGFHSREFRSGAAGFTSASSPGGFYPNAGRWRGRLVTVRVPGSPSDGERTLEGRAHTFEVLDGAKGAALPMLANDFALDDFVGVG